jgi:hypothetical protein
MDKVTEALLEALKQGMAEPGEQRLFRSGKLSGLFAGRNGVNAEASVQALRDGLLETVRTETKGKTAVEWVRVTPRGVDFVHQHESPVRALDDLRLALKATQEGVPAWLAGMQQELQALSARLTQEVQAVAHRLESLSQRVVEALRRAEAAGPAGSGEAVASVPWGLAALAYLDRRRTAGAAGDCPLPELFAAVRQQQPELTLRDFHDGLRRLHDRGALRLLPFTGPNDQLPEPEYALLDGASMYFHVTR